MVVMVVEVVLGVCLMVEMMVAVVAALGSATTTTSPWSIDKIPSSPLRRRDRVVVFNVECSRCEVETAGLHNLSYLISDRLIRLSLSLSRRHRSNTERKCA